MRDKIRQLIDARGEMWSLVKAAEEPAELTQAVAKYVEARLEDSQVPFTGYKESIIEEIVDVLICIKMLCQILNIPDEVIDTELQNKMQSNLKRAEKLKKGE